MPDRRWLATVALLMTLAAGGCSIPVQRIGGVTVGPAYDCAGDGLDCADVAEAAIVLDDHEPGHPDVKGLTIHHEDPERMLTHSGTLLVVAFDLVDGTTRIVSVYSGPGGFSARLEAVP